MLVKAREKQISFLFQEMDPFFEIGFRILEQEHMDQMLPYTRSHKSGREKLIFHVGGEGIARLMDEMPKFGADRRVALLYEMIYLNKKVEENGFLKKECIWYKYDNIYFNRKKDCIMTAVLPITGEFQYADDTRWYGQFEETVGHIVSGLSDSTSPIHDLLPLIFISNSCFNLFVIVYLSSSSFIGSSIS